MQTPIPYTPPEYQADGFNCPYCHAFADQRWGQPPKVAGNTNYGQDEFLVVSRCSRCGKFAVWIDRTLTFPPALTAHRPNPDLPEDIQRDYEEARAISPRSPRGAAALLRLATQKLCKHLGEEGKNINKDIAALVEKGLPAKVQQALDIVRVVGNNAVHPGQIDLRDDASTASMLFGLVNLIADVMITQPKQVETLYSTVVPENLRDAITKRDAQQSGGH